MSDTSQGPGWWLASDGRWYPPHLAPGASAPPPPDPYAPLPGPTVSTGLTRGTQVAAGIAAAAHVAALAAITGARSAIDTLANGPVDLGAWNTAIEAEDRAVSLTNLALVCQLVSLVVLIVWMWRAHTASDRLRPGGRSYTRGWTIGGWFIPFANFVLPRKVMTEIEQIATSPREGGRVTLAWRNTRTSIVGWAWWLLLVASVLIGRIGDFQMNEAVDGFDIAPVVSAYSTQATAAAVTAAAMVCLIPLLGRIGRGLDDDAFAPRGQPDPTNPTAV